MEIFRKEDIAYFAIVILSFMRTYQNILSSDPIDIFDWIQNEFIKPIPCSLETADDLKAAGNRLGELANLY